MADVDALAGATDVDVLADIFIRSNARGMSSSDGSASQSVSSLSLP